jgi:hypothetical protein
MVVERAGGLGFLLKSSETIFVGAECGSLAASEVL